jgi:AcrR family transcriptional regulator
MSKIVLTSDKLSFKILLEVTACHLLYETKGRPMPKDLFFSIDQGKKNRIIEAAMKEFSSQMYENSSINQIIKEAEISRGSFYQYFKDKDDLYYFMIKTLVNSTAFTFLKQVVEKKPQDIFAVYQALFAYNLQLLSEQKYMAFFMHMYLGMNYRLQQELRSIFNSIRNEMLDGKLDDLRIKSGYDDRSFQELINLLELNNRDLLMQYISNPMDECKMMEIYQLRIQVLQGIAK